MQIKITSIAMARITPSDVIFCNTICFSGYLVFYIWCLW